MRSGRLRHRVILSSPTYDETDYSGPDTPSGWDAVGTFWAEVAPASGREAPAAEQLRADATHKVTMRRVAAVKPGWKLTFRGRTLNILQSFDVGERRRELALICSEVLDPS